MKRKKLEVTLRARVSKEMHEEFMALLAKEEEGVLESDLLRRAVRMYLDSRDPKKVKAAKLKAANEEQL